MDPVTLGMAKSFARQIPSPSPLTAISGRMKRKLEDVVLTILGDSTGNATTEWVYLTAQWLAARYPAYTVLYRLWNDTTQGYDSVVTIQTGTGSKTLTIYNGSMPGGGGDYSTPRLAIQVPVAPHAIIMSYGHNSSSTTARTQNYPLVRAIRESFPNAALVLTAQNPRATTETDYANNNLRQQSNIDLAQSEGLGLINVFQRYLENPTYSTDWVLPDGIHTSDPGSLIWRDEVIKHFRDETNIVPAGPRDHQSQIWIPARAFELKSGSPVYASTNDLGPTWSFPATGTSVVHMSTAIPPSWDTVRFYAKWLQVTASGFTGANNICRVQLATKGYGVPGYNTAPSTNSPSALTSTQGPVTMGANNSPVTSVKTTYLGYSSVISFGLGSPLALEIKRFGDDALDTYADPWILLGVMALRQT